MTTMSVAQKSSRAAKVLAAAEELVVKQGFKGVTMSAVAQRAHVGKGTPYLYWNTKEDLFLEIIARSLADVLHDLAVQVRAEPALAVAERLCVALAKAWLGRPLVRALQVTDADVLGAARLDGAHGLRLARSVELPMAAPSILAGLRTGFTLSFTGAVVGEMVTGGDGLGLTLTSAQHSADVTGMFAAIALLAACAMCVYTLFGLLERRAGARLDGEGAER